MTGPLFPLALALVLAPWQSAAPLTGHDLIFLGDTRPVLIRLHIEIDGKPLQAAWLDYINHWFRHFDRNGDGVLTANEASRLPGPRALLSGLTAALIQGNAVPFRLLDTKPVDGKVTVQEFAEYYRQTGGGPLRVQLNQAAATRGLNESLIARLDADKDVKLAKAELTTARSLLKFDLDDDEFLTAQELGPNPYEVSTRDAVGRFTPLTSVTPMRKAAFLFLSARERTKLAGLLHERYGTKRGARQLSRKEISFDAALFDRLDGNKDENLDAAELGKFADQPPDLQFTIRLGTTLGKPRLEQKANGSTKLAAKPTAGLFIAIDNASIEFRAGEPDANENAPKEMVGSLRDVYRKEFKSADVDKNGYLELKEARQSANFAASFKALDRDGDGKLYEKEALEHLDLFADLTAKALTSHAALTVTEGQGLFGQLDTNQDGRLSLRELHNAPKGLANMDRDGDGRLSSNEILRDYRLTFGRNAPTGNSANAAVYDLAASTPLELPSTGPLWFRKMDRNRDGDVSPREFLGPKEKFQQLDADGDGLISADEAKQADAKLQK